MCHLRVLPGRRCWTVPFPSGSRGGKALSGSPVCDLRLQHTLRSRYAFCVMSLMAQGAHRGTSRRRPLYPRAPASNIAAARSLRLIPAGFGSGRGSVPANTALSPHPCGLPRPSGNVSAMLRPPAPAVSAAPAPAVIWGCRPGKAQPPSGINAAPCLMPSPGGAVACRAYRQSEPDE